MLRYFEPMTIAVIFGGLVVLVIAVVLRQVESLKTAVPVWIAAGLVGLLLGIGGTLAAVQIGSFVSAEKKTLLSESLNDDPESRERIANTPGVPKGMPQGMMPGGAGGGGGGGGFGGGGPGGGPGGGGGFGGGGPGGGPGGGGGFAGGRGGGGGFGGGGPGGGGGGPGGGGGGFAGGRGGGGGFGGGGPGGGGGGPGGGGGGPRARRDLPTIVGKLDLLTHGVRVEIDSNQSARLNEALAELDKSDEMTEEAAQAFLESVQTILTAEQKAALDSIDLPRRLGGVGRGGGPGGGGGGPGGGGGGPGGGGGAGAQPSNDNPFKQDENANRLKNLRDRLGAPTSQSKKGD